MYESSDWWPDAFDESRFVMTFLTILGVMEILCSFRLVVEGKKFFSNSFALSDAEDNASGPLNRENVADLPCWKHYYQFATGPESHVFRKVMNYIVLIAYAYLFGSFKNVFAMITSLSELYFRLRR